MHLVDSDIPKLVYRPWRGGDPQFTAMAPQEPTKHRYPPLIVRPKVAYFGHKS